MTEDTSLDPSNISERTFLVGGQKVSVSLNESTWAAFDEYRTRQCVSEEEICARALQRIGEESLAEKLVGLLTAYYRDAAASDPPPPAGLAETEGEAPPLSAALRAALDAVGKAK